MKVWKERVPPFSSINKHYSNSVALFNYFKTTSPLLSPLNAEFRCRSLPCPAPQNIHITGGVPEGLVDPGLKFI